MENENELTGKSADSEGIQVESANKSADNIKEKYLFIKNRKRNSKTLIILGVVLFFAIAIAGAYFLSINRPPEKSPQEIIKSSMETMSSLKTYQIGGKINFNGSMADSESKKQSAKINIIMSGKNDATNYENPKAYYNVKVAANLENEWGSENYSADFEEMVFGQETAYFKINDYNLGMEMGTILGPQIESYKGKWYFLSMDEMQKYFESFGNIAPMNAGTMKPYDESKIMEIISKYEVLKFESDLGDEKINEIEVYHYKAKLDGMAIIYMYMDIMKEVVSGYGKGEITSEEFEAELVKLKKDIEENYQDIINEGFQKADIEMWIGKEDGYVYRIIAKGGLDEKYINKLLKTMTRSSSDSNDDQNIKANLDFNMDLSYSNFNQPMGIEKPEGAENLGDILKSLISGLMGSMAQDSDGDGLGDDQEILFKTDKNNPDTDGDGYKDGEEVKNGYDPALPGSAKLSW